MSLYTHEEICEGCCFARWIDGEKFFDGQPRFARCEMRYEDEVDPIRGRCSKKEPGEAAPQGQEESK